MLHLLCLIFKLKNIYTTNFIYFCLRVSALILIFNLTNTRILPPPSFFVGNKFLTARNYFFMHEKSYYFLLTYARKAREVLELSLLLFKPPHWKQFYYFNVLSLKSFLYLWYKANLDLTLLKIFALISFKAVDNLIIIQMKKFMQSVHKLFSLKKTNR